ncbi:type II CAAX endopeptidase family protein [Kordia sp.]|uniref:CPBP family intramembrane glutamic endopeptidase n=1 Tax=Kordia sp. TaxID=1965332 RepID=UPI0025BACD9B|nr:type II CAAX endopeptidase family protein [Kordia sp.]MCH2196253.1 CPBP family intramembrane metalloprotease [Kordia sp.]
MNTQTFKNPLFPFITTISACFIWYGPLRLGYFTMIVAALVIVLGSYVQYKGKLFSSLGFQREKFTSKNIVLFALLVALILFLFYTFILVPGVEKIMGVPIDYSGFEEFKWNLPACLIALPYIWVTAGFGEEIVFRGYFMRQFTRLFGESKLSIIINIIVFACFFGFLHAYQGITGQIVTGVIGALLATIFYLRKYDLWFVIAVHGFFDTIALICVYFDLL